MSTRAIVKQLQKEALDACRRYGRDSMGGAPNGALESGSLLRLAAKRMTEAEMALENAEARKGLSDAVRG